MGRFHCEDSRRLTGANLYSIYPGAVLDLLISDELEPGEQDKVSLDAIVDSWNKHAHALLDAVSWDAEKSFNRQFSGGVSLVITAPIDGLYSAVDLAESALILAGEELKLGTITGLEIEAGRVFDELVSQLKEAIKEEANPALLSLQSAAIEHDSVLLFDDDIVSLGYGASCQQWPVDQIPHPDEVSWDDISFIPLALITGTNGKSTSVRLAASVAQAAGLRTGSTSTDYIKVRDSIIDEGDYSGPGGARMLLRDKRVELALLEVARGGLLRRGLGVPSVDAVLITNVAADHLGEYGINTVQDLIEAKFIVRHALTASRPLILNADDEGVVKHALGLDQCIIWFAEKMENIVLQRHIETGGEAVTIEENQILHIKHDRKTAVVDVTEIPITFNGMARHNVQNSLGVVALSCALGIDYQHIRQGLLGFKGDVEENPGRGNFFEARGIKILIDFAHNEHGMTALASTAVNIQAQRRLILMGQAGDRSNEAIADLVNAAMKANPDQIIVSETPGYERGREVNEVSNIIVAAITATGFSETYIKRSSNPVEGVQKALDWARPGDFLLFVTLTNRDEVIQIVKDFVRK
jgi:UDP-N-acetylmuramyl tripeptide synthase